MTEKRVTVWVQRFADRPHLVLQWLDPDTGKRKSRTTGTADEKEAERKRADLEYELNHGLVEDPSNITWERFRRLFEAEYVAGTRTNTRRNFTATFDVFEEICSPKRLAAVNERTVSQYAAGLRGRPGRGRDSRGTAASTIKVRLQFLHTALSWAVQQKMLPRVPQFPAVKAPARAPLPVPAEPFERLLDKTGDVQMRAYLLCGWLAGLRLSEALSLEWEQTEKAPWVDLDRNRIQLPAEVVKAGKDQWVPLDPELRSALLDLPRDGVKMFRFIDSGGRTLTASGVSQRVRYLAKKAGVRLTMKTLRRGFGCRYAGTVSAHVLQRLMRHANIKTTLDYYANIDAAVEAAVLGASRNTERNNGGLPPALGSRLWRRRRKGFPHKD